MQLVYIQHDPQHQKHQAKNEVCTFFRLLADIRIRHNSIMLIESLSLMALAWIEFCLLCAVNSIAIYRSQPSKKYTNYNVMFFCADAHY